MVDISRLLLFGTISLKAGEYATHKQLIPQNPLSITQWLSVISTYDINTILIVSSVFLLFLILLVALKKHRRREVYEKIVYVPMPELPKK